MNGIEKKTNSEIKYFVLIYGKCFDLIVGEGQSAHFCENSGQITSEDVNSIFALNSKDTIHI